MGDQNNCARLSEQAAPEISVCVHVEPTTRLIVDSTDKAPTIRIAGYSYPSVVMFFPDREKLAELGAAIGEYLDGAQ